MTGAIDRYLDVLDRTMRGIESSDADGGPLGTQDAIDKVIAIFRRAHDGGGKVMFIGNGGSAAIASHMAIDYAKNGGMRAMAFNDAAALTCLGNDEGFENIFSQQVAMHGREGDVLVAISCSGESPDIVNGVAAARDMGIAVVTVSGFDPNNRLRSGGDFNFYVPSGEYGIVEVSSQALLHGVLDIAMGWTDAGFGATKAVLR